MKVRESQEDYVFAAETEINVRALLHRLKGILDTAMEQELRGVLGGIAVDSGVLRSLNDGKKMRGCLTCLIGLALGAPTDSIVPRAVAVELIQAATLIHDDYVDQDRLRRNRPAVWTLVGPRRAVLIGDVMFASAISMMSSLGNEDGHAVARAIALISAGALKESSDPGAMAAAVEGVNAGQGLYEEIIRLKTGIFFGTACELGVIAAGAEKAVRLAAYEYGVKIGEAYQIADDVTEIERCVSAGRISGDNARALVPACASFAPEIVPDLLRCLHSEFASVTDRLTVLLKKATGDMEKSIEERVKTAVSGLERTLPAVSLSANPLLRAPSIIIKIFRETEASAYTPHGP